MQYQRRNWVVTSLLNWSVWTISTSRFWRKSFNSLLHCIAVIIPNGTLHTHIQYQCTQEGQDKENISFPLSSSTSTQKLQLPYSVISQMQRQIWSQDLKIKDVIMCCLVRASAYVIQISVASGLVDIHVASCEGEEPFWPGSWTYVTQH